jgi:cellobiose-specific phosphotransferase system component IIB
MSSQVNHIIREKNKDAMIDALSENRLTKTVPIHGYI